MRARRAYGVFDRNPCVVGAERQGKIFEREKEPEKSTSDVSDRTRISRERVAREGAAAKGHIEKTNKTEGREATKGIEEREHDI